MPIAINKAVNPDLKLSGSTLFGPTTFWPSDNVYVGPFHPGADICMNSRFPSMDTAIIPEVRALLSLRRVVDLGSRVRNSLF